MKRGIYAGLAVLLLVIGGCTVISANNYTKDLAIVTLTSTVSNCVRSELTVTGEIYYKKTMDVEIPTGCTVEEIFAEVGDHLTAGSPLLRLKEVDLQIAYYQKLLKVEALESVKASGGTEGELAMWQLQILEEEISALKKVIDDACMVRIESDGYVIKQGYAQGDLTISEPLVKMGISEEGCYLECSVNASAYKEFTSATAAIKNQTVQLSLKEPVYDNGKYVFKMNLPELTECKHGEPVEVQFKYVSEEYKAVLPKSCIWYDTDGSAYVFEVATRSRNFGEESYVRKVGVTIEEQDNLNAAVKSPLSDIVLRSSQELWDMAVVVIVEE